MEIMGGNNLTKKSQPKYKEDGTLLFDVVNADASFNLHITYNDPSQGTSDLPGTILRLIK